MTAPANTPAGSPLARIRRKLREVKLPYAAYLALQRVFRPGLFEYDHQYVLSLDLNRLAHPVTEHGRIREVTAENRGDLEKLDEPAEAVLARFARGQRAWVLEQQGRILAFDWIAGPEKTISDWLILTSLPGDFWGHFLKVSEDCRGMGLGPLLRHHVCVEHARAGYSRLLSTVDSGNRNSISYQLKAGAVPLGRFRFLSILGVTLLKHGRQWRIGLWSRHRPLRLGLEDIAVPGLSIELQR